MIYKEILHLGLIKLTKPQLLLGLTYRQNKVQYTLLTGLNYTNSVRQIDQVFRGTDNMDGCFFLEA